MRSYIPQPTHRQAPIKRELKLLVCESSWTLRFVSKWPSSWRSFSGLLNSVCPRFFPLSNHPKIICTVVAEGLRILQWNYEWLATNSSKLNELLTNERIEIADIQETKMLPKHRAPCLDGFSLVHRYRPGAVNERGGGFAFAVRRGIGYWITKHSSL